VTNTFQKAHNLYLYIPPLSAHPISCFKGLITGEIYRYWLQNTDETDFIKITTNFILRLLQRGHQLNQILPILHTAAANIDNINTRKKLTTMNSDDTLFIHWRYHPADINKNTIRQIYNNTLKGFDGFQQMRLAISRPKISGTSYVKRNYLIFQIKTFPTSYKNLTTNTSTTIDKRLSTCHEQGP
jgi:hypothetical protein